MTAVMYKTIAKIRSDVIGWEANDKCQPGNLMDLMDTEIARL